MANYSLPPSPSTWRWPPPVGAARIKARAGPGQARVEAAGGRVWVESRPGEGSTFYLEVPAEG